MPNESEIKNLKKNSPIVISSPSLEDLLLRARQEVIEQGSRHQSQRGSTATANGVMLVWENAGEDEKHHIHWDEKSDGWYQEVFVEKNEYNDPSRVAQVGEYLFPYKYAHRSRYYDGGWGYVFAVLNASNLIEADWEEISSSWESFLDYLSKVSEYVHLQTALSVFSWLGLENLTLLSRENGLLGSLFGKSRVDSLEMVISEVASDPLTRRAVTPSFFYPHIEGLLNPRAGVPPYQFFQLLPAAKDEPLSSLHLHRSLDLVGGAQLDFHHDLSWLSEAAKRSGRPLGDVTVVASNAHVYLEVGKEGAEKEESIEDWLSRVTDGYLAQDGEPPKLLEKDFYRQNAERIFKSFS